MEILPPAKPDAPSCARNRDPILAVLRQHLSLPARVLEVGSGTGQHAIHFARHLPELHWQCTDLADNLPGIGLWLAEAGLPNTPPAIALDVRGVWPEGRYDAIFTANTLHIMGWADVLALFAALPTPLKPGGKLIVYGPFNYRGQFTSASNAGFDQSLKARNPAMGIRDFEALDRLAQHAGLGLIDDIAMPANNRCLVWQLPAS